MIVILCPNLAGQAISILSVAACCSALRWSLWHCWVYFYPLSFAGHAVIGIVIALVGVLANALSSILGRRINRSGELEPMTVTAVTMGIGAVTLLISGIAVQGLPRLTLMNWLIIFVLAVVNSAFAFSLWNHTLRTLSAMQSSIINNTMLFQIALLAWIFLKERLSWREIAGMILAACGVLIVQIRKSKQKINKREKDESSPD